MVTVTQLVSYVLRNRKEKVFIDWTVKEITDAISTGIDEKACVADVDDFGNIRGVIIGSPNYDTRVMHIVGVITTSKFALRNFILWLRRNYGNDWRLTARRSGKFVEYNPEKLLTKLYGRP